MSIEIGSERERERDVWLLVGFLFQHVPRAS